LFYALLKQVGFEVMMVSACVYDGKTGYSPEFDHMALVVKLNNQQYLVDVGFGEFSLEPILLELNAVTHDTAGDFIISQYDEQYLLVSKPDAAGKPAPEYIFSLQERSIAAFYDRCLFHQQSNESHFTQKRICSLPTIDGRITLTGNTLKITKSGIIREQVLKDEKEVEDVLWNYFGISL
jgi:N-hydroxyarylamine O-acetyltransferase